MYGNIKAQCDALGISIPYFYSIVLKYCGSNYVVFMATNAVGKRKETYLRKISKFSDSSRLQTTILLAAPQPSKEINQWTERCSVACKK